MKRLVLLFACYSMSNVQAASTWLTIVGNPEAEEADTVEVDVTSVARWNEEFTASIRVNRASRRVARDKFSFRSYTSTIAVDCTGTTARHLTQTLYERPLWAGNGHTVTYKPSDVRPMAFLSIQPNPSQRIISAICASSLVQSK